MTLGKIFSYPGNPRVMKIQAVANLSSVEIATDPDFEMGVTNRTPEFLAKFPMGKAPTFEGADGIRLFESDAIAQYVAESGSAKDRLLGVSVAERAKIRQWISFAEGEVNAVVGPFAVWHMKLVTYDEKTLEGYWERLLRALGAIEAHLTAGGKTWLTTEERLNLADISLAAALYWGFALVLDPESRGKYPAVMAWYERTIESEGVKEAFGEKMYVDKRPSFK
ncbi:glutathione S-transferase [Aspergillus coremiiformis]|uniref:Glutathione S-transferase n=1 Tax=Aspergillus coremiiformis TaxID=138285 RepID=A0A5N6ZE99_9EURO|nr:glutathione S-transferase [Aspergillus coremiiformis]